MPSADSHKILIVAAEASSCLYAQRLLEYWHSKGIRVEAFGIGNEAMARQGFECLGRAEDLAVMGFSEILSHMSVIKKAFNDLIEAARRRQPKAILLMDYGGFNLRFAKKIKSLGIPIVYYISPQVWASRSGRVKTIRQVVDKMLVVYPFEVDFYSRHGMSVEFVGHPLLDEMDPKHFDIQARAVHRSKYGIGSEDLVLALMPGSRNTELKHHLQVQLEAARLLYSQFPNLKVVLLVAPNFNKEQVQAQLADLTFPLILVKEEPFAMIDLADVVLCASGTATLQVGLLEKPMVIMYKTGFLTAFLARRLFSGERKYFGLINLVLDELVVPEYFQEQANAAHLANVLGRMLNSATERLQIAARLRPAKGRLGNRGATERVAHALETYWR